MRAILAVLMLCAFVSGASAHPRRHWPHRPHVAYRHHGRHYLARGELRSAQSVRRHRASRSVGYPCNVAASLGGPCGCFASELIFGHSVRELWPARAWYGFPRTTPHAGAAAVHPHHVVIVESVNSDGTFIGHDSWGLSRRRVAGWTFVEPRGGRYASR